MGGICGYSGGFVTSSAEQTTRTMTGGLLRSAEARCSTSVVVGKHGALGAVADGSPAFVARARGYLAAVVGSPVFSDEEVVQTARKEGPARALIQAFARSRRECCARIAGAFAFAVAFEDSGELFLAVDRMGIHGLRYAQTGSGLVFGSTAEAVFRHPSAPGRRADLQALFNYVYFHATPAPFTGFEGIQRLLPGQYLSYRDGSVQVGSYWSMDFREDEARPFVELREQFRSVLSEAVRDAANPSLGRAGAFLSGGTDSSTIAGLLCQEQGHPAQTFSIGFAEQGYDEMEYARIASRHFTTVHHEYYVTPEDIVDAVPRLAGVFDEPFGNSSAIPTYCCARLARQFGMDVLLAGDGGDELFGGNERYATQHLYSLYGRLPGPLRTMLLEPLAARIPEQAAIKPLRWARRLVELGTMPMPERMQVHNLLARLGVDNVFTADFLDAIDPSSPAKIASNAYTRSTAGSLVNKMLGYDLQCTLADSDLPKVTRSCELAGVQVTFPMLDDRVVSFSSTLPPSMKLRGTRLRPFFKEALHDFLPREIIRKSKHGFGLPFGPWAVTHAQLRELVMDSLSALRKRALVRSDFLDRLTGTYLTEHPGYYGTMAWVLMMLELWFQQHCESAEAVRPAFADPIRN